MTQVLAAGNWTYVIVAADQRFTYEGKLLSEDDDERNKLILLAKPNGTTRRRLLRVSDTR